MKEFFSVFFAILAYGCTGIPVPAAPNLPPPLPAQRTATCVAVKPVSQIGIGATPLWGHRNDFWPQRATLRVQFLDGTASQHRRAWYRFGVVDKLVNLTFVRVDAAPSEIRVAFAPGGGHWSYVGRGNLTIRQGRPTMNLALGSFDSCREWNRVAIHEVLHAAGFQHEHQHPQSRIPWNVPVVLRDYRRDQGWSDADIFYQVINRDNDRDFIGSAPDPKSLMQYPIPREHVIDPAFAVGWNSKLSVVDIQVLKNQYP